VTLDLGAALDPATFAAAGGRVTLEPADLTRHAVTLGWRLREDRAQRRARGGAGGDRGAGDRPEGRPREPGVDARSRPSRGVGLPGALVGRADDSTRRALPTSRRPASRQPLPPPEAPRSTTVGQTVACTLAPLASAPPQVIAAMTCRAMLHRTLGGPGRPWNGWEVSPRSPSLPLLQVEQPVQQQERRDGRERDPTEDNTRREPLPRAVSPPQRELERREDGAAGAVHDL
jgi:hypothetical protein